MKRFFEPYSLAFFFLAMTSGCDSETPAACHQELDCAKAPCDTYQEAADRTAEYCGLVPMIFEGQCGAYTYRVYGGGYTGNTSFWRSDTGVLVARRSYSDITQFCDDSSFEVDEGDSNVLAQCATPEARKASTETDLCASSRGDAGTD